MIAKISPFFSTLCSVEARASWGLGLTFLKLIYILQCVRIRGRREKGGINGLSDDEKHNTTKKYSKGSFSFQFRLRTQWVSFISQKVQQKFQNELTKYSSREMWIFLEVCNMYLLWETTLRIFCSSFNWPEILPTMELK